MVQDNSAARGRTGRTRNDAIVVASVGDEYAWLDEQFGLEGHSYDVIAQMLLIGALDQIVVEIDSGEKRSYYFDISSFHGR